MIRLVFAATVCFGIWHSAGVAVAAGARDCIAFEESEAEDAITYRNDCNRTVIFYYCVIDPQRSEVAPCRRIITGTRAEDWTERSEALAIRIDLPREAPCEGIGSLSKTKDVAWVPVNLTPSVANIIRKAEQLAARLSANRARKRFASLLRKSTSAHGKARSMIAARAAGKHAKGHPLRLASSER